MDDISKRLEVYIKSHKFDGGTSECETVLDQIYQACEFQSCSHMSPEI